jgi:hypothetical protein
VFALIPEESCRKSGAWLKALFVFSFPFPL